ncbi:hypothetical protein DVJ78_05210 [Humibacter sp. BT305]|uniref:Uncharacterized protein n=1 Tax=Cnuibacter physcomitrellae TaxID=1619308 RepID=A0A1X9LN28_9MICO|nr:hypothetical protein [Cnuibacter physcomitrellae]ARJ06517.1 hypothetical protein B5808_15795 [Cnuibacter physcomitrellae]AXH34888.1 hypothetical protein DVJ78_05210 [Humibacter sp. BT305]MCS5495674.1 hypothetical protein [Cnuibacter physcomitrellae]GGI38201.1 hypothetical protein GCM10010988_17810 [Cnuibacter physcomitrellae]
MTDAAADGQGTVADPIPARRGRLHHRFVTPEAIYGTILFCAVLTAAEDDADDFHLMVNGLLASLVLWFAHVVAMTVARHGSRDGRETGIRAAVTEGLHHSTGVLIGPAIPLFFLVFGAFGVVDEDVAYWLSIGSGVAVLVVLGILSCRERRVPWPLSLAGGLAAGAAGFLAVVIKATLLE